MKVKAGFTLNEIEGQWVLIPNEDTDEERNCVVTLSASAALLWTALEKGVDTLDHLANALLNEYEIEYNVAFRDAEEFIDQLKVNDMLE